MAGPARAPGLELGGARSAFGRTGVDAALVVEAEAAVALRATAGRRGRGRGGGRGGEVISPARERMPGGRDAVALLRF
ncbi:MAG: hypothetical protein A2W26_06540 [Acidobacteria bacterium RBG_16_64_8]|nr:MAG: hypothetical protein A2W26_06540 [Acidobacteria bacterium RBG_16_64_8]